MSWLSPSYSYSAAALRIPRRQGVALLLIAALHLGAIWSLSRTEYGPFATTLFLLTWGALNFFWLALLRRPALAAVLSLMLAELIIVVSKFKFEMTWMTISFMDVLIVDADSISFLFGVFPDLRIVAALIGVLAIAVLAMTWRLDPVRMRVRSAALGGVACLAGMIGLSMSAPEQPWEPFQGVNHVSNFTRSGVAAMTEVIVRGFFDAEAQVAERLRGADAFACEPRGKRPHIVLVLDESSFDMSSAPGVKLPPDYAEHFRSFDGKTRSLLVETMGGQTWLAEYSALTGLSARSFGGLKFYVTRIAAGRVTRGLPNALKNCGYRTFSLYPSKGAFLSARHFQQGVGIERFIDAKEMGAGDVEPDHFYYDKALGLIERERGGGPVFVFVYTLANHFPWDVRYRPNLTLGWRDPGNGVVADEYMRRQMASARDYKRFAAALKTNFPGEPFLIVRFGDHPPNFAPRVLDPELDEAQIAMRIKAYHPRYYTTYYTIDGVNFAPKDMSSAIDGIEVAHLPLVVQEAAGLPLDPSFAEQKKVLQRCGGLFYRCKAGAEARRFNRLLIDAGLITGL